MLKFFRRIRLKLLKEGSLRKYLVYAIGEILLVVVGILIALQINNWSANQAKKKEEIKTLKSQTEFNTEALYPMFVNQIEVVLKDLQQEINKLE